MRVLLLVVMFIGNIVLIPVVNTIHPVVAGLPFFLFWVLIWMIITPILTWWIYSIDNRRRASKS